jgi:hypothetical protein
MASQKLEIPGGDLLLFIPELLTKAPLLGWDVGSALGCADLDPLGRLLSPGVGSQPLEEGFAGHLLMFYGGPAQSDCVVPSHKRIAPANDRTGKCLARPSCIGRTSLQGRLRVRKDGVVPVGFLALAESHDRLINGVEFGTEHLLVIAQVKGLTVSASAARVIHFPHHGATHPAILQAGHIRPHRVVHIRPALLHPGQ